MSPLLFSIANEKYNRGLCSYDGGIDSILGLRILLMMMVRNYNMDWGDCIFF
jgi:hypothetical protein